MAIQANDVRKGMAIKYNNDVCMVLETTHRTPGNLRAFVQATIRSLKTNKSSDIRFSSTEKVEVVDVSRSKYEFSYMDAEAFVFTEPTTFETITLQPDMVGDAKNFITDNQSVEVTFVEDIPVIIELPPTVSLKVTESADGVKGDSANNVMKPAKLETGISIQVPLFIKEGEIIKVDTRTGDYVSRA
ncbi:MAG: elongation factor P [Verrucomicrobiota bacterium]|nr:elongation factor P [Verrucomicrobiota bacterium]